MKVYLHLIEYYAIVFTRCIVKYLPISSLDPIGKKLGSFVYSVLRIRRGQVMENLKKAFPEKTEEWRKNIAKNSFQHSAVSFLEFLKSPEYSKEYVDNNVTIIGRKNLDQALKKNKGAILASGHFGNWEWGGLLYSVLGYPTNVVMIEQHNLLVHGFITKFRMMHGINCISTKTGIKEIIRRLRNNEIVCMLYDQDARGKGIFVEFFNHPASTHSGLALIAWKTGAPIITSYMCKDGKNRFRMIIDPPLWADKSMDRDIAIMELTKKITARLEKIIREYPSQWFWYHRRWKTAPRK